MTLSDQSTTGELTPLIQSRSRSHTPFLFEPVRIKTFKMRPQSLRSLPRREIRGMELEPAVYRKPLSIIKK